MTERAAFEVTGLVQGVGFRPFVHGLATALDLRGFVQNRGAHVLIDVEGAPSALASFEARLRRDPPPSAVIDGVERETLSPLHRREFVILGSQARADAPVHIPADVATCADCLRELFDPANRRYRHPFVVCAHCGPRHSMITRLPFDRGATSMAAFRMCADCASEYGDPRDRRFHAQGICCPACGPRLFARDLTGERATGEASLRQAEATIAAGGIVAVKGIGGFHLACDATSDAAILELRRRKRRDGKPLAVMLPHEAGRTLANLVPPAARDALLSRAQPIVVIDRAALECLPRLMLSRHVAPEMPGVGVFLPYSPVHHLLLADLGRPLVMTSGNTRDEPMACDDQTALGTLAGIAELWLSHDRAIVHRCDDSVTRASHGRAIPIRRGRGDAPAPVTLAERAPWPVLGVGGDLKNTFCFVEGSRAYVSAHVGNLESVAACEAASAAVARSAECLQLAPAAVVHDTHPDALAARMADMYPAAERIGVQHHHAHVLSCLAEHRHVEPAIGVAFDGAGLGDDGTVWGGEFLLVEGTRMQRAAHLARVPLPGGDAAAREPWRMALAHLEAAGVGDAAVRSALASRVAAAQLAAVARLVEHGPCAPPTSSVGRLFDAVAALLGLRDVVDFEGQAAMTLEAVATHSPEPRYAFDLDTAREPWTIHAAPVIRAIADDLDAGRDAGAIAADFHRALAEAAILVVARLARRTGIRAVALTGGVFQNARLAAGVAAGLAAEGLDVLEHRIVPCNDGGLSLGQALFGLRRLRARST